MASYEIDLRERKPGCTESPMVRLTQLLSRIEGGGSLKVTADEREVPMKTLELLARKRGLGLKVLERSDSIFTVLLTKP